MGLLSPRSQLARNAGTCLRYDQTITTHYPGPQLLALNANSRPAPGEAAVVQDSGAQSVVPGPTALHHLLKTGAY